MSACAANSSLFSIFCRGVNRSLRLITAKSLIRGAPSMEAADEAAVMPGMISMGVCCVFSWSATSKTMPAMPYTPGSPLLTMTTFLWSSWAFLTAILALSTSLPMVPEIISAFLLMML